MVFAQVKDILEDTYADIRSDMQHKVKVKAYIEPDQLRSYYSLVLHLDEKLAAAEQRAASAEMRLELPK